ncbi:MAG: hypothetical protein PHR25_04630 [Clostridia bacterium]|nr:hypothetical protein [Clostridia bacterium]MDD4376050.1 hypothetical protein [Clostridia bacterium]
MNILKKLKKWSGIAEMEEVSETLESRTEVFDGTYQQLIGIEIPFKTPFKEVKITNKAEFDNYVTECQSQLKKDLERFEILVKPRKHPKEDNEEEVKEVIYSLRVYVCEKGTSKLELYKRENGKWSPSSNGRYPKSPAKDKDLTKSIFFKLVKSQDNEYDNYDGYDEYDD